MKSIAVFCGSYLGNQEIYKNGVLDLADEMSAAGITLVYGGAKVGVMGVLANQMLKNNGKVIGVMPKSLVDVEIAHPEITELKIVTTMHERKALMEKISEGFILLPGSIGSLDEFFEIFTWAKLGIHAKPIGILNLNGYYDQLLKFMEVMVKENFLEVHHWEYIITDTDAKKLLHKMQNRKFDKLVFKSQYADALTKSKVKSTSLQVLSKMQLDSAE